MRIRPPGSSPSVTTAGGDLVESLRDLTASAGRWLALQPAAQELPVHVERARQASTETLGHAGDWAGATATRAKVATADAAGSARTLFVNLLIVTALLWWVDRLLTRPEGE